MRRRRPRWTPPGSTTFLARAAGVAGDRGAHLERARRPGQALGAGQALLRPRRDGSTLTARRSCCRSAPPPRRGPRRRFVARAERTGGDRRASPRTGSRRPARPPLHAIRSRASGPRAATGSALRPGGPPRGSAATPGRRGWTTGASPTPPRAAPSTTCWTDRERPPSCRSRATSPPRCPSAARSSSGNSMPIRDLDYAMAPRDGLRVLANRGASGIDGLVSTALGIRRAATADGPAPTVALLGDLSLLLRRRARCCGTAGAAAHLTIVVPNNGGGQIFAHARTAALWPDELSPLFTTPHEVDLGALCVAAGASHALVEEAWAFGPALEHAMARGGLQVVEVGRPIRIAAAPNTRRSRTRSTPRLGSRRVSERCRCGPRPGGRATSSRGCAGSSTPKTTRASTESFADYRERFARFADDGARGRGLAGLGRRGRRHGSWARSGAIARRGSPSRVAATPRPRATSPTSTSNRRHRSTGLGARLLRHRGGRFRAEGFSLAMVWPSDRSFPFYERGGFARPPDPLVLDLGGDWRHRGPAGAAAPS